MRKLVLIALLFLNVKAFSQVVYTQNFSTLTLNSYTATNGSGSYTLAPSSFITLDDGHNNNVGTFSSPNTPFNYSPLKTKGWLVAYNAIENDTFLVSTSWLDSSTVTSDKWIVTAPITVSVSNMVLRWNAKSPDPTYKDGYEVYATPVTGTPTRDDFTLGNRIFVIADNNTAGAGENSNWTSRSVLLDQYLNQTVRFAFRNNSKDRFQLWIDDIQVATISSVRDIVLNKVEAKKYNLTNVSDTVWATFTNIGSQPITTLVLNYQYGTSIPVTQTLTSTLGWGNMAVAHVSFAQQFNFTSPGIYPVKVWASQINGSAPQVTSNDTAYMNVTAITTNVPRTVLMEQFVSAFDGDSPDAQEKAQALSSSSMIVVNVHSADAMQIPDALSLFFDFKKANSTAIFDRFYFKEVSKVAVAKTNYIDKRDKRISAVSPASVTIVNKNYNSSTRELSFTVKADFVGEVKGDYRINAYLTENHVYGDPADTTANGYNQLSGYYSVPWSPYYLKGYFSNTYNSHVLNAWQFSHNNVLIKAFDGVYGFQDTIPSNGGTTGNSYTASYTVTLPTFTTAHTFVADNIYIVGFVGELGNTVNERTILNSTQAKMTSNAEVIGLTENPFEKLSFTMFPNPSEGKLYIGLSEKQLNKYFYVSIKDLLGRTVHTSKLYSTMHVNELNVQGLETGTYIVELEQNGQKTTQKLIVRH